MGDQNPSGKKERAIPLWTRNWARQREIPHVFLAETESASLEARAAAFQQKPSPRIFIAERQRAGRGRQGKRWENSDLMASWLWDGCPAPSSPRLSEDFASDLLKAAKNSWPDISWRAKPPNDLYTGDKKIAGILPEVLAQGADTALILGLGFNVFSHPPLIPKAGHLGECGRDISREKWEVFLDALHSMWTQRVLGRKP